MRRFLCFAIVLAAVAVPATFAAPAVSGYALIYDGPGAAEGGAQAIAAVVEGMGYRAEYIVDLSTLPAKLAGAAFFAVGGTEDDLGPILSGFTPAVWDALVRWIKAGGRYLGICGGAYIASRGWEDEGGFADALGLLPLETWAHIEEADPVIVTVTWGGAARTIYYQYGPCFEPDEGFSPEVLARYDDGTIAALSAKSGAGRIVLCGPHPEADETWLDDDPEPKRAGTWKPTDDLAVALLAALLKP